jgi:hypothetical protein
MKRMTNEEALDILVRQIECDNDNCPEPGMSCSECPYNVDPIDYARARKMAIEALRKQCASTEQPGRWIAPGELFMSDRLIEEVLYQIGKNDEDRAADDEGPKLFGKRTIIEPGEQFIGEDLLKEALDHNADSDKKVDQFREDTKKTEDVPDINVGKTDFKPGDKFILELGQERRMFGEFEIKGTDLYVETSLLEKLTRYEPISLESAIDYLHEVGWLQEHDRVLTEHSQPEKIPYKKPEIICDPDCVRSASIIRLMLRSTERNVSISICI